MAAMLAKVVPARVARLVRDQAEKQPLGLAVKPAVKPARARLKGQELKPPLVLPVVPLREQRRAPALPAVQRVQPVELKGAAAGTAALGAGESATGVGAVVGIPTMVAAAGVAVAGEAAEMAGEALEEGAGQAVDSVDVDENQNKRH